MADQAISQNVQPLLATLRALAMFYGRPDAQARAQA